MPKLKVSLLTGRTLSQGQGKEYGKLSEEYWKRVAVCEIDPEDMKHLEIKEGQNVKLTTSFGSAVVRAVKSARGPHPRVVFIPYGPWANLLVNPRTHGTGMPSFKGLSAEIEPAPGEKVLSLEDLMKKHYERE